MKSILGLIKKLRKDDKGSAIVMVIIALSFIGIMGATIMWVSLSNYRMKINDQENKQGFYTAESVLEQIKTGLQGDASRASASAYGVVMQNFNAWNEDQRQSMFQQQFKRNLVAILSQGTGTTNKYSVDHLASFVDGNLHISTDATDKGDPIRFLSGSTNIGDYETGAGSSAYLMLEDIELEFTDDEGYYSNIVTDIMISAPSTSFMDSSTLPPIFKYALIADTGVEVGEGALTVKGSMYAGDDGINTNKDITVNNASYTVSKGPLNLGFGNEIVNITSNVFYAADVKVENANLLVNSNTRVADDLTLSGTTPYAKLEGTYCGFGDSMSDTAKSSAILINGLRGTINMNSLNNLIVAGHSFIGTSRIHENAGTLPTGDGEDWSVLSANNVSANNVLMGESISVKGNQLAYLVPDDCIGVKGNKTLVGKNPLTYVEYSNMVNEYSVWANDSGAQSNTPSTEYHNRVGWQAGFEVVSFTKAIPSLGGSTLGNYVPAGGSSDSKIKMVFVPSNGETMVYIYINFADSDAANRYSRDFYNTHKNKMDAYADVYAEDLLLPSGNLSTAASTVSKNATSTGRGDPLPLTEAQKRDCKNYSETYTALCTNLTERYSELTAEQQAKTVFSNILDEAVISSEIPSGGTVRYTTSTGLMAIVTDSDTEFTYNKADTSTGTGHGYVFDGSTDYSKVRVIIATGDVYVTHDFSGLIIAKGNVVVGNSVTLTSTEGDDTLKEELIGVLQSTDLVGGGTASKRPVDFFRDGNAYIRANSGSGEVGDPIDFSSAVNYQNWVKR